MLRILGIALFLIVLVVGIPFATVNDSVVDVYYFIGSGSWPLSLVLVFAFSLGILVAAVLSLGVMLPLRWQLSRLKSAVIEQEQEMGALRRRTGRNLRQA